MIDLVKLKLYYEIIRNQIYAEGDSPLHKSLTERVVRDYIDKLNLAKDSCILDIGCGPGYFLDEMASRGYTGCVGITASKEDIETCQSRGHTAEYGDISFIKRPDESVDLVFCRQTLEHSVWPYITLLEYNRLLKQGGYVYVETPAPDNVRRHEDNVNHYSVLGWRMLHSLLHRAGFDQVFSDTMTVQLHTMGEPEDKKTPEHNYIMVYKKQRPVDIK